MDEKMQNDYENDKRLFAEALTEALAMKYEEDLALAQDEGTEVSPDHKIFMNRLFKETVGSDFVPFPEIVD